MSSQATSNKQTKNTHSSTRLGLSKKKKSNRKKSNRTLPYENKSMNDSDEELGWKERCPYTSPLPALPEGSNLGFKKSETRNL